MKHNYDCKFKIGGGALGMWRWVGEELDAAGGMGKGSGSVSEDKARSENKEEKEEGRRRKEGGW